MKFLVLELFWGAKKLFIFKDFLINFFGNISSNRIPIKLPNDPSCSMHVLYKASFKV